MRIITGKYKGRSLFTVDGRTTRPTTSYNREVIFSVYQDYEGKRVLDLFAGTGSFGLEALSRGAVWVDFVEFAAPAISALLKNIGKLGCGESCHVWRKRVEAFLNNASGSWDVIFLDPPYAKNLVNPTLGLIFERSLLAEGGVIIAEHSPREPIALEWEKLVLRSKTGKTSSFTLLSESPSTQ
ncbi:MAG: 16S rRNA (guanine(966)-N(2))-methyltransferase RsmD [Candidatus Syntrophosphaera sp.]|nr:16S rRNA (guanine(966)-N(2))-methyltransferase RsmD [Candidatus Syntrophosphaera sp.]